MPVLENFPDLFKYARELLEDEYNLGQSLVVKTKSKSQDGVYVRSIVADLVSGMVQQLQAVCSGRCPGIQDRFRD